MTSSGTDFLALSCHLSKFELFNIKSLKLDHTTAV